MGANDRWSEAAVTSTLHGHTIMGATAVGVSEFTLPVFHELTPHRSGARRAELFFQLPPQFQQSAWADLSSRIGASSCARWEQVMNEPSTSSRGGSLASEPVNASVNVG